MVVLDGQQPVQPTPGGDDEVAPMSELDKKAIKRIAASLVYARAPCVFLPPKASKYGVNPIFDVNTVEMASIFKFHGIVYYQPEMWNEMRMYNFCYPMDTTSNRRLFTRLFQLLLRLLEWHASVRDKYCANDMVTTGDNKEITCMFKPHHMDPAKFKVPETWRETDQRAAQNRVAGINTGMPTPLQIQRSLGTDPVIARKLHKDFVDYSAQCHARFDKRDRVHLDAIANQVENGIAKAKKMHIEQHEIGRASCRERV